MTDGTTAQPERRFISSGSPWEALTDYSRAVLDEPQLVPRLLQELRDLQHVGFRQAEPYRGRHVSVLVAVEEGGDDRVHNTSTSAFFLALSFSNTSRSPASARTTTIW